MTMKRAGRHAWSVRVPSPAGSVIVPAGARVERAGARRVRRLGLVERRDDLCRLTLGLDLRPDARDVAVPPDQESGPCHPPVGLAVVLLLDPRAVRLSDRMVLVGQERERQFELLAERALAGRSLGADAPDVGAALVDGLVAVAELACLDGAAGRVVLGVEVE